MVHLSKLSYLVIINIFIIAILGQWLDSVDENIWRFPMVVLILLMLFEWRQIQHSLPNLTLQMPEYPRLGRTFITEIVLENPTSHRMFCQSKLVLPAELSGEDKIFHWDLSPNQIKTQSLKVIAEILGNIDCGVTYIRIKGIFSLIWWEKKMLSDTTAQIVPDYLDYKERVQGTNTSNDRPTKIVGSGYELLSIRDYMHGDPMRSIDWKASAKHDKYKVRVMTQEQNLDMLIMLDIGRYSKYQADNLSRLSHGVNLAARLGEKAILNGDSVGLMTFADTVHSKIKPSNSVSQIKRIRNCLTKLESIMAEPNLLIAAYQALQLLSHRSLVIIVTDLERKDTDGQLLKSVNLLRRKHFTIVTSIINQELIQTLNKPAKDWIDPYIGLAAREILSFIQNNRMHLHEHGVQTVATTPNFLDERVFRSYEMIRARQQV